MAPGKASASRARATGRTTTSNGRHASRNGSLGNGHSHADAPADPSRLTLDSGPTSIDQLFDLQRSAGNAAVSAVFSQLAPLQRQAVAYAPEEAATGVPRGAPADIDIGFNPMDISHRLREAIDQSQMALKPRPDSKAQGPMDLRMPEPQRHVDFPAVVNALSGLTRPQIDLVDAEYMASQKRHLRYDLLGLGESGVPSDLTADQVRRVSALLEGTRAAPGEDPELARLNQIDADAAELHEILSKKKTESGVEQVMAILRRHADKGGIASAYEQVYKTALSKDLAKLGIENALRAGMLLAGSPLAADVVKVNNQRARIAQIDEQLDQIQPMWGTADNVPDIGPYQDLHKKIKRLTEERKKIVEDIIATLELAGEEARELVEDPAAVEAEGRRRQTVLAMGDVDALAADVAGGRGRGAAGAMVVKAIVAGDAGRKAAGELRQLHAAGKLTSTVVADKLRALRDQAAAEAQRLGVGKEEWEVVVAERELAERYFNRMRDAWDADPEGPRFDEILGKGSKIEGERNRALAKGLGHIEPVDEVIYALSGSRKDLDTVKRVLRDMHADEVAQLKTDYHAKTNRQLDFDLFGEAPTRAGESNPVLAGPFGLKYIKPQGKAAGTNRLVLEDYFQRAQHEGGWEEVAYLSERAEREYEYTIENRGITGWWRDKWGNEAKELLDETIKEIRSARKQYAALVVPTPMPGMVLRPEQADTPQAQSLLLRMRHARATIRGDREGYEKATAELRAKFQAAAAFAIQMALSAVLGPAVSALVRLRGLSLAMSFARWARNTSVAIASTVGSNAIVYGNEYNAERFKKDLVGGLASSIGSAAAEQLVPRIAYGFSQQLGQKLHPEIIKMAGTYGSTAAGELVEGGSPIISVDRFVQEHLMGKAQEFGTERIQKGLGIPTEPHEGATGKDEPARPAAGSGAEGVTTTAAGGEAAGRARGPAADVDVPEPRVSMTLPESEHAGGKVTAKRPNRAEADPADVTKVGHPAPPPEGDFSPNVPDTPRVRANREAQARRAEEAAKQAYGPETSRKNVWGQDILRGKMAKPDARARARAAEFTPLYGDWPNLSPEKRRARLEEAANMHLRESGLPPIKIDPAAVRSGGGYMDLDSGQLHVSAVDLVTGDLSPERFGDIVDAVVHESRHALQYFRGIRAALMHGRFDVNSNVPGDWVVAAREANAGTRPAEPMLPLDVKTKQALAIYEEHSGEYEASRREILAEKDAARDEFRKADAKLGKLTNGTPEYRAAYPEYAAALARYKKAHDAYVGLSEEVEAWRIGGAAGAATVERINLERNITSAEVSLHDAETAYREVEARYEAARADTAGGPKRHVSLTLQREYRKARNRWLAKQRRLELLRRRLAGLTPG